MIDNVNVWDEFIRKAAAEYKAKKIETEVEWLELLTKIVAGQQVLQLIPHMLTKMSKEDQILFYRKLVEMMEIGGQLCEKYDVEVEDFL